MKYLNLAAVVALCAGPALAESHASGDAAAGEEQFNRQCVACHVVVNDAGETLAGRNARTGPNLYGVAGRVPGSVEGFDYGDAVLAFGETGVVWDEEHFVGYVQDPTGYLREQLQDRRARGKMAFQVRDEQQARDIYAYLASLAAPAE